MLLQLTCTQEASSTSFRHRAGEETQPSLEGVGALTAPLELKLRLSELQPLFYTSCQRAMHEYVCQRGRSHNLCKVSSCIMQPIYASPGCECARGVYTHTPTHTQHSELYCDEEVNKPQNLQCFSHPELPVPNQRHNTTTPHVLPLLLLF